MKMVYVLVAALATGVGLGISQSSSGSGPLPSTPPSSPQATEPRAEGEADEPSAAGDITGEVLESIDVPKYSYYRVGAKGSEGTWTAVPSARLKVGDPIRVRHATKMVDFQSTTLKRTFGVIYFGSLEGAASPHGAMAGSSPHGAAAGPHGSQAAMAESGSPPHQGLGSQPSAVEVKPVDRAKGANGKTVAEVIAQRTALAGKSVRIHATVVKSTPGVLGKTYLHLRDGSGDAASGTNDLAATTEATPAVGETIDLEGIVALDQDIGSGYKFSTLVEAPKQAEAPR